MRYSIYQHLMWMMIRKKIYMMFSLLWRIKTAWIEFDMISLSKRKNFSRLFPYSLVARNCTLDFCSIHSYVISFHFINICFSSTHVTITLYSIALIIDSMNSFSSKSPYFSYNCLSMSEIGFVQSISDSFVKFCIGTKQ